MLTASWIGVAPAQAVIYISGAISNRATHAPLAGVDVSLYAPDDIGILPGPSVDPLDDTRSLPNGSYVLKAPSAGSYCVVVREAGYLPINRQVPVPAAGVAAFNLFLSSAPTLHIDVQGPDNKPLPPGRIEGWVWLLWRDRGGIVLPAGGSNRRSEAAIRAGGRLDIPGSDRLPLEDATTILVEVRAPGVGVGQVRLQKWSSEPVTLSIHPGETASGIVQDAGGKALPGVQVRARRAIQERLGLFPTGDVGATTDAAGHFELKEMFHDLYQVSLVYPGLGNRRRMITVPGPAITLTPSDSEPALENSRRVRIPEAPLSAILERFDPARARAMAVVFGRVLDRDSKAPIPKVLVSLYTADQSQPVSLAWSGEDGSYTMKAPPLRKYILRIDSPAYLVRQQPLSVPAGGMPAFSILLRQVPTTHVRLVGQDGKPVTRTVQAYLSITWGQTILETTSDLQPAPDGTISLQALRWDVPPGEKSSDEPAEVLIGCREDSIGYGQATFTKWPEHQVTVALGPGATLSGVVIDNAGKPLAGIPLTITRTAHTPDGGAMPRLPIVVETRSSGSGRFEVAHLPHGTYSILENYRGNEFRAAIVRLTGERLEVTVKPPNRNSG